MWWDDQFNLTQHGDAYERLWWPLLENHFPEWQQFWIHHIVPLTNRIDKSLKGKPEELFLRRDELIDKDVERMVMAHYSVFYFLGRASVVILTEPHLFPEDAFIFLQTACENALTLLTNFTIQLGPKLGVEDKYLSPMSDRYLSLASGKTVLENQYPFKQIKAYRNAFIHHPRMGRNPHLPWEFIPKYKELGRSTSSWGYVQNLPEDGFENARDYLQKIRIDLLVKLNGVWKQVRVALDSVRKSDRYLRCYGLDARGNILNGKPG